MTTGILLASTGLGLLVGILAAFFAARVSLIATCLAAFAAFAAAMQVLFTNGAVWDWQPGFAVCGEAVHLRLDGLSALFLALLSIVGGAGAIYAREYWNDAEHPRSARAGRIWWNAIILALGIILTTLNGLHFLIAWELFAVSAYFLITLDRRSAEVRAAGWLYLAASHVAALCLFAFFATLAARTGSWELGDMRDRAALAPLFWLALAGFGLKAGMFPLHVWLPSAHANAPSHVSAMLSGVTLKIGIYGLVRFSGWLPTPASAGWVVAALGVSSAVLGVAFALGQHDFKRLLAYHSVENIGIILIGLGFAMVAATQGNSAWGRLALAGGLLHVWNHGLFKSLLFFAAGSVVHKTGTREMSQLGGLWRVMPWTATLFAIGGGGDFRLAAAQWLRQRMAGLSRFIRCDNGARASGVGCHSSGDSARSHWRTGTGLFCKGVRRDVFGRAAFQGGAARPRKWCIDARPHAFAGSGMRRHRPRARFLLARHFARG